LEVIGLETVVRKLYEGLFLIDSAEAAADWEASLTTIKNILRRAKAEIVSIKKWDERKLAYEIGGKTRGTYILVFFRADGKKIQDIERDVQLSERIMRVLILCAEMREKEDVEKDTPAVRVQKQKQEAAQVAAEIAEEKEVSIQEAEKEAGESVQSLTEQRLSASEPVAADAGESERLEQTDTKESGLQPTEEERDRKAGEN